MPRSMRSKDLHKVGHARIVYVLGLFLDSDIAVEGVIRIWIELIHEVFPKGQKRTLCLHHLRELGAPGEEVPFSLQRDRSGWRGTLAVSEKHLGLWLGRSLQRRRACMFFRNATADAPVFKDEVLGRATDAKNSRHACHWLPAAARP